MSDIGKLRQRLRKARRELDGVERRSAANLAIRRIRQLPWYANAKRIALYVGVDGELCPLPLADAASSLGKQVFLPVLHPFRPGRLLFIRWQRDTAMRRNRFGIPEPALTPALTRNNLVPASHLDLIVVPLLGFDLLGNRVGMGGGFYDRTFAFRRHRQHWNSPLLVGLAHEVQRIAPHTPQSWDVRLDAVATNAALYRFT